MLFRIIIEMRSVCYLTMTLSILAADTYRTTVKFTCLTEDDV